MRFIVWAEQIPFGMRMGSAQVPGDDGVTLPSSFRRLRGVTKRLLVSIRSSMMRRFLIGKQAENKVEEAEEEELELEEVDEEEHDDDDDDDDDDDET